VAEKTQPQEIGDRVINPTDFNTGKIRPSGLAIGRCFGATATYSMILQRSEMRLGRNQKSDAVIADDQRHGSGVLVGHYEQAQVYTAVSLAG